MIVTGYKFCFVESFIKRFLWSRTNAEKQLKTNLIKILKMCQILVWFSNDVHHSIGTGNWLATPYTHCRSCISCSVRLCVAFNYKSNLVCIENTKNNEFVLEFNIHIKECMPWLITHSFETKFHFFFFNHFQITKTSPICLVRNFWFKIFWKQIFMDQKPEKKMLFLIATGCCNFTIMCY